MRPMISPPPWDSEGSDTPLLGQAHRGEGQGSVLDGQ